MLLAPAAPEGTRFEGGRRALLGLFAQAALAWAGRGPGPGAAPPRRRGPCLLTPEQTEGPYFVDEGIRRSDLRSDPADGRLREGLPLRLDLRLAKVVGGVCTPWPGARVDLWHCDAQGLYSGVEDEEGRFDTRGKAFLRGYQLSDGEGRVHFLTLYPGWYPGRTVHLHLKIRTNPGSRRGRVFTSQLYFDEAVTDRVHAGAPYAARGPRDTRNEEDGLFRRGGSLLLLPLSPDGEGYAGAFEVGLRGGRP